MKYKHTKLFFENLAFILPLILSCVFMFVYFFGFNETLFLSLNKISEFSGAGFWANLTVIGDGYVVCALILLFSGRRPDVIWAFCLALGIAYVVVTISKSFFGVLRPPFVLSADVFHLIGHKKSSGSFPSGHAAAIACFATVIALNFNRLSVKAGVLLLALLVGLSRIVVGIHWPLDVIAGLLVGSISGVMGVWLGRLTPVGSSVWVHSALVVALLLVTFLLISKHQTGYEQANTLTLIIAGLVIPIGLVGLYKTWKNPAG